MTHTYQITGMTCASCEAKVRSSLLLIPDLTEVIVSRENQTAIITMEKHIPLHQLQKSLDSKYTISALHHIESVERTKSWLSTYKPVLLIFAYLLGITLIIEWNNPVFSSMRLMNNFMGGFFLIFSFFKILNLKGFAESYSMYDVLAKKWNNWAYVYAFIELILGICFISGFQPFITNTVTLIVMSLSIIGVLQTVLNKRKIQCACLGDVFNLPMSTITIIEDGLMILMSGVMIMSIPS